MWGDLDPTPCLDPSVKDLLAGGEHLEVIVRKPRWVRVEPSCGRKTITRVTGQFALRARCLTRLRAAVLDAVIAWGPAVEEVAGAVAW